MSKWGCRQVLIRVSLEWASKRKQGINDRTDIDQLLHFGDWVELLRVVNAKISMIPRRDLFPRHEELEKMAATPVRDPATRCDI